MISLIEAPTPVTKPYQRPFFNVRCMHNIPTGPIGAEAMIPMRSPFRISAKISMCIGNGMIIFAKLAIFYGFNAINRYKNVIRCLKKVVKNEAPQHVVPQQKTINSNPLSMY